MRVRDHEGKEFPSISAMCRGWGISRTTYCVRRENGWSMEEALTKGPYERIAPGIACVDHLGNRFVSIKEMCRSYGIDCNTFQLRRKRGKSLEEALTTPIHKVSRTPVRLESGEIFRSMTEFCIQYGLSRSRVVDLRRMGRSFDEILEGERVRQR